MNVEVLLKASESFCGQDGGSPEVFQACHYSWVGSNSILEQSQARLGKKAVSLNQFTYVWFPHGFDHGTLCLQTVGVCFLQAGAGVCLREAWEWGPLPTELAFCLAVPTRSTDSVIVSSPVEGLGSDSTHWFPLLLQSLLMAFHGYQMWFRWSRHIFCTVLPKMTSVDQGQ